MFQIRPNDSPFVLHFGRLTQQFFVDQYIKIESQRLDFHRTKQADIRNEFLQGIQDCFASGEKDGANCGHRTYLPPTFIGGPRDMRRRYLDAMALVQEFGWSWLFLQVPKKFCNSTTKGHDAYPVYRRRNNGLTIRVRGQQLDNRWVVPYNPFLLAKYNCHINVEICATVQSIKYIYKYICKGHDKINFHVGAGEGHQPVDEIKQYQSARWVSPQEAAGRIFRFTLTEMKPAVIHLQLHLENFQCVHFNAREKLANVLRNPFNRKTMLTEFFFTNRTNAEAQRLKLTYPTFPSHFVWNSTNKFWQRRKNHQGSIGRVNLAHPTEAERYYLRLLLTKVRCPTSFHDLLKYQGKTAASFKEACSLRGLLQNDNSQELCLHEAATFSMPYELRRLFATLLVYCEPQNPRALWELFEQSLSEDFAHAQLSPYICRRKVLAQIGSFLLSMGKRLESYNLIDHQIPNILSEHYTKEVAAERGIVVHPDDLQAIQLLNEGQRAAFEKITAAIYSGQSTAFFVDGPGGTGKSFLYRALLADVRSKGFVALANASSGIAASLLPGGRTAHSRFKIPVDTSAGTHCRISKQSALAKLIQDSKLILWDEVTMSKKSAIEALNDLLQDLLGTETLFGGKVVVLGGDFRQTLPIVKNGNEAEIISACIIHSTLWPSFQIIHLTENMRARFDPSFTEYLLRVGNGIEPTDMHCTISIPPELCIMYENDHVSVEKLTNFVYPCFASIEGTSSMPENRMLLSTKNCYVDELNSLLIDRFPGELTEYYSRDETINPADQALYEDMLNSLSPGSLPPHRLALKVGAPIILLRNLDSTAGLCNGTRLMVKILCLNVIHATICFGEHSGKDVFLHRIPLKGPADLQFPVSFKRVQFPVRLCFAMTINKSQGQTLDRVGIYLKEPVFSHGQLYVALSRVRSACDLKILIRPSSTQAVCPTRTKNIVYKQIIQPSSPLSVPGSCL